MRNPIVIIGGMGPQASLRFHELLITKSTKYHSGNGDEFPFIVHYSLPIADFISDESQAAAAIRTIDRLAGTIELLRPEIIALACNTAHLLVPHAKLLQRPTFLPMLDVVASRLHTDGISRVGLLASPTTVRTKLYKHALADRGIELLVPDDSNLSVVEAVIRSVIAGNTRASDRERLARLADHLVRKGAQTILLGCTELPLIFPKEKTHVPVYDCLDIYAEAVIEKYYLYNGV